MWLGSWLIKAGLKVTGQEMVYTRPVEVSCLTKGIPQIVYNINSHVGGATVVFSTMGWYHVNHQGLEHPL